MHSMPPTERAQNRYGEGSKLRSDLLDATVQLMARHGSADQLTLRAIAREVGVSPTAIYRHFDGHEEMVVEAVTRCWNDFEAVMSAAAAVADPFDAMLAAGGAYLTFAEENPGRYQIMFSNHISIDGDDDCGTDDHTAADTADHATFDILVSIVQRILHEVGDPRDPRFVAFQVFSWVHGIASLAQNMDKLGWPGAFELLAHVGPSLGLGRPTDMPTT